MGTQKNRLDETVLLSTQTYAKIIGKKYLQFYAEKFCLSKPMHYLLIEHEWVESFT